MESLGVDHEAIQKEDPVATIEQMVGSILPEYSVMDRAQYDAYDPKEDTYDRGQILSFYTKEGKEDADPRLMLIFRKGKFVINFYHTPEPLSNPPIRNQGGSLCGPKGRLWEMEESDLALEAVKIQTEGVDPQSDEFLSQLVAFSEAEGFLTMADRLEMRRAYVEQGASFKGRVVNEFQANRHTVWNLYESDPEHAVELAIKRIEGSTEYVDLDGSVRPVAEVIGDIQQGTDKGKKAVMREINKIDMTERLLKNRNIL